MSRRTNPTNAYQALTTGLVSAGSDTIPVDVIGDLDFPGHVTLSPFSATLREVIRFEAISGSNIITLTRGLAGSVGGVAHEHPSGAIVIAAPTEQLIDDIFSDVEDLEAADITLAGVDASHAAAGDPHVGYQLESGHTKAQHDALNIDADTLDGLDSLAFVAVTDLPTVIVGSAVDLAIPDITTSTVDLLSDTITIPAGWNTYDVLMMSALSLYDVGAGQVDFQNLFDGAIGTEVFAGPPTGPFGSSVQAHDMYSGRTATGVIIFKSRASCNLSTQQVSHAHISVIATRTS